MISVTVNDAEIRRVCGDLNITIPTIRFAAVSSVYDSACFGHYTPHTRTIEINLGADFYKPNRLLFCKRELNRTVLHELRHAHQHAHWPRERWESTYLIEKDAREYEAEMGECYKLIGSISRPQPRNPRLARIK